MPLLSTLPAAVPSIRNALLTGLPPWSPFISQQGPRNNFTWAICSRDHGWNIGQPQGLASGTILQQVTSSSVTHSSPLDLNDKYLPCSDSPIHFNTDPLQLSCQTGLEDQSFTSLLGLRSSDADGEGKGCPLVLSGQQPNQVSPSDYLAGTQYPGGDQPIYPVIGNIIHCNPHNSTLPQTEPDEQIGMNRSNNGTVIFEHTSAPLRNPLNSVNVPEVPFLLTPSESMTAPATTDDIVDSSLTQSQICATGSVEGNFFAKTGSNPSDSVNQVLQSGNVVLDEAVAGVDQADCCKNNEVCAQGQCISNIDDKEDLHQCNDEFLEAMLYSPHAIGMESLSMFVNSTNGSTDPGTISNAMVPSMETVNIVLGGGNYSPSEANHREESAQLVTLDAESDGCKSPRYSSNPASPPSTPDNVMSETALSPTNVLVDQRKADDETGPRTPSGGKSVNKPRKISKREAAKAASELEHRRERAIALLANTNQITDEELLRLKPKRKRRVAKFDKPIPSRFCHICRATLDARFAVCSNIKEGICRKVICEKCFARFELGDFKQALESSNGEWTCPHCKDKCPIGAQCWTYRKTNDDLRAKRLKQQKPFGRKRGRTSEGVDASEETNEEWLMIKAMAEELKEMIKT